MPLNTLRLNHAPSSHPNDRVVFIKPLPRPTAEKHLQDTADIFLHAIAAQCLPIMKSHHLSVTTLEEYEPNPEFIGRNFNNGEIIQLVLRSKSGSWIPFNMVQMVMMHELAHNLQMNHGKKFWETRNTFTEELKGLWARGYTGEGFWGGGRCLGDLREVVANNAMTASEMGEVQICGGTFRSRRRKRKRNPDGVELTSKEKRDRRIEKKFGKNGQGLGEDEGKRMMLEIGKKGQIGGKPRVAQSKRGRELRAAAALARFDTDKKEIDYLEKSDTNDSEDEYEESDIKGEDARDLNGQRMLDGMGFRMVKVCEEGDGDDIHVKQEMAELEGLDRGFDLANDESERSEPRPGPKRDIDTGNETERVSRASPAFETPARNSQKHNSLYDIPQYRGSPTPPPSSCQASAQKPGKKQTITIKRLLVSGSATHQPTIASATPSDTTSPPNLNEETSAELAIEQPSTVACLICSLENDRLHPTCLACAHVLDPRKDPRCWRCVSEACSGSQYINAGDAGICGVCNGRKTL